jgi:hypothetical protein
MAKSKNTKSKTKKSKKTKSSPQVVYVKEKAQMPSIGAQIGDGLQKLGTSLFTKWMGTGDYTCNDGAPNVKSNALIRGNEAKSVKMSNDRSNFIFEHSEYVTDIVSSSTIGAFSQQSFTVNPINANSFPWLSNLAGSFETYEIEGMLYRFVSTSGQSVASSNTAIGSVMGTFVYDALDPAFVSKQQLLQYDDTVDCRTSENFICGVECDKDRIPTYSNKLYIGVPPTNSDPKTYNFGNFVIATQGVQAASVTVGELWVSYRIKCHVTKDTNYAPGSLHIYSTCPAGTNNFWASTVTTPVKTGTLNATITPNLVTVSGLQIGAKYLVTVLCAATTQSYASVVAPVGAGAANYNYFAGNTTALVYTTATTVPNFALDYAFTATAQTINFFPFFVAPTNNTQIDIQLSQLDQTVI